LLLSGVIPVENCPAAGAGAGAGLDGTPIKVERVLESLHTDHLREMEQANWPAITQDVSVPPF